MNNFLIKAKKYFLYFIALLMLVFTLQNMAYMEIDFFTRAFVAPKALVVVIIFGVGFLAGKASNFRKK